VLPNSPHQISQNSASDLPTFALNTIHSPAMVSAMVSQTVQGAVLSATSNILAQAITSYKDDVSRYQMPRAGSATMLTM
jgi:hypothetical protein